MRSSYIRKIYSTVSALVAPYVNLGMDKLNARISPWVDAGKNKIDSAAMTIPAVTDTCTSCNVPLVSYCCAAEGVKRDNIIANGAQEASFFGFVNIPQLNILANYAHVFCAIDIDSFRLAMLQQIVAPCPHRETYPEIITWKRLTPPKHRSQELAPGDERTKVNIRGMGVGQWNHIPDTFPGGYRGNEDPKPYKPRPTKIPCYNPQTRMMNGCLRGKETRVQVMKRLHNKRSIDPRYKFLSSQINYIAMGTPAVPYRQDEGYLDRVEKPKWYRQVQLPVMHRSLWYEGIRIRPHRNGKVDRVTGNMEYNDAFRMEGSETQYPRSLNYGKDHPLAPTNLEVILAKPAHPRMPICLPGTRPRNNHHTC